VSIAMAPMMTTTELMQELLRHSSRRSTLDVRVLQNLDERVGDFSLIEQSRCAPASCPSRPGSVIAKSRLVTAARMI